MNTAVDSYPWCGLVSIMPYSSTSVMVEAIFFSECPPRLQLSSQPTLCYGARRSFPAANSSGSNLARAHQIANVLLQEFVIAVQLVVLLLYSFYAAEYHGERSLQCFRVSGNNLLAYNVHIRKFPVRPIAHLSSSSRASCVMCSRSSLVRLGLMALTSSASKCVGTGPT
jgi:hypothetical protein